MKKAVWIIGILSLLFTFWLFSREPLSEEQFRTDHSENQFVKLSLGWTEFRDKGSAEGENIILIHGFSVPLFFWEPLERRLTEKGFRVFSYNQYGRGYSSRPKRAPYDRAMYTQQLEEFMDSLGIKKAHLVGQSMGAAIGTHFAISRPDRVQSLTLLSPMLDKVTDNGGVQFCRTPIIGCPMTNLLIANIVYKRSKELVYTCENVPHEEWLANMREQAKIKGFRTSLTTLFLSDALANYRGSYEAFGKTKKPALMVTGGQDNSIPQEHFEQIEQSIPIIKRVHFPENNHVVLIQQVDSVTTLMANFYNSLALKPDTLQMSYIEANME